MILGRPLKALATSFEVVLVRRLSSIILEAESSKTLILIPMNLFAILGPNLVGLLGLVYSPRVILALRLALDVYPHNLTLFLWSLALSSWARSSYSSEAFRLRFLLRRCFLGLCDGTLGSCMGVLLSNWVRSLQCSLCCKHVYHLLLQLHCHL